MPAVRGVSFRVAEGEIVGLVGPNGAGKSTTPHAITGLVPTHAGHIRVEGESVVGRKPERIAQSGVRSCRRGADLRGLHRRGEPAARTGRAAAGVRSQRPTSCSRCCRSSGAGRQAPLGGQQQQLAIARGLVAKPRLLLLDEPSLGLAPTLVAEVFETLARIREQGVTILLVEQRPAHLWRLRRGPAGRAPSSTLGPADADDTDRLVKAYLAG